MSASREGSMPLDDVRSRRHEPVLPCGSAVVTFHGSTVRVTAAGAEAPLAVAVATAGLPLAGNDVAATIDLRFHPAAGPGEKGPACRTPRRPLRAARVARMSSGRWSVSRCADHVHVRYDVLDRHTLRRFIAASLLQGYEPEVLHCFHGAAILLPSGAAALLLGASKAGKTTLSRALADLGCVAAAENFVLLNQAHDVLPFIDPIFPGPRAVPSPCRLKHLVVLSPGSGPIEQRKVSAAGVNLAEHSVSRHFDALYGGGSRRGVAPAAFAPRFFAGLLHRCSTSVLRYAKGADAPESCARVLLETLTPGYL